MLGVNGILPISPELRKQKQESWGKVDWSDLLYPINKLLIQLEDTVPINTHRVVEEDS